MYRRHANYWLSTASSGGPRYGTHVLYNNHELAEPSSRPSRLSNLARFCPAGGSHLNQWANITTAETGYVCSCVRVCGCVCIGFLSVCAGGIKDGPATKAGSRQLLRRCKWRASAGLAQYMVRYSIEVST